MPLTSCPVLISPIQHPKMHRPIATTDPLAATEQVNLFDESFTAFLRSSRTPRTHPTSTPAPQGLSPRLHGVYSMSPRLPSALPPSASPRVFEPITPDRGQPVLPFYNAEDAVGLPMPDNDPHPDTENERRRRVEWARSAPQIAPVATTDVGVVDEDAADKMFSNVPKKTPTPQSTPLALSFPTGPSLTPIQDPDDTFPVPTPSPLRAPSPRGDTPLFLSTPTLAPLRMPSPFQIPWSTPLPNDSFSKPPQPPASHNFSTQLFTRSDDFPTARPRSDAHMSSPNASPRMSLFRPASNPATVPMPLPEQPVNLAGVRKRPPRRNSDEMDDDSSPSKKHEPMPVPTGPMLSLQATPPFPPPRALPASDPSDPLRCKVCGQRFARVSNLRKHLRSVHEVTRRFVCSLCPYKFKRQDHLLKHMRSVHAKVRNFSCQICGSQFAEKFNRDKHTRSIHETKRAFQCPCGAYHQDGDKMQNCLRCRAGTVA